MEFIGLPDELILRIILSLNLESMLTLQSVDKSFNNFYIKETVTILRVMLNQLTRFDTSKYGLRELNNLTKLIFTDISAGLHHSLLLDTKGHAYSFGSNNFGQLGIENDDSAVYYPTLIMHLNECHKIYTTNYSSYILVNDGKSNVISGNREIYRNVKKISSAGEYLILMSKSGNIYTQEGVLGFKVISNSHNISSIMDRNNEDDMGGQWSVSGINNAIDITGNNEGFYILTSDNTIHCSGHSHGVKINFTNIIVKIISGNFGFAAITLDRNVFWCYGTRNIARMVIMDQLTNIIDISVSDSYALALNTDNRVYTWGKSPFGKFEHPTLIDSLTNIIKISAGYEHSLFIDYYGNIHSIGYNKSGQLGLNDTKSRLIPEIVPNFNLL